MDKNSILLMSVGSELDVLISEKVINMPQSIDENGMHYSARNYSTNIAAAWEIVEKFEKDQLYISLSTMQASCLVEVYLRNTILSSFKAATAPEAICKAALLATLANNQA